MSRAIALQPEQPDLFARTPADLRAEIMRHGGGTPPRPAPPAEEDEINDFSPVQVGEACREIERRFDVVAVWSVSLNQLAAERRELLL